jgi:hypothetical protein
MVTLILSDQLNNSYAKFYSSFEHLAVDEVTVPFKGRVVLKQYIPKKHKCFGMKIQKLCDMQDIHTVTVYFGKDRQNATKMMTTHVTVRNLTRREERVGHKLHMKFLLLSRFI